jgi:hypothetical protein
MADYKLTLITAEVERTTWWKDENHKVPSNTWWFNGPGESRPATVIEIALWQRTEKVLRAIRETLDVYEDLIAVGGRSPKELLAFKMGPAMAAECLFPAVTKPAIATAAARQGIDTHAGVQLIGVPPEWRTPMPIHDQ